MTSFFLTLTLLGSSALTVQAYEYRLQFTPGGAYGLEVAGYSFHNNTVEGNCSYYTVSIGSGRDPHSTRTNHYNICSWDLFGNLISLTPVSSPPVAPPPLSEKGTEIVYAIGGSSFTGADTRGFGFVSTPSSHYTWLTANGGYAVIPYAVNKIDLTLRSDGDFPLDYDGATVTSSGPGYYTATSGTATVLGSTCANGANVNGVPAGSTCSVTVSYNPTTIQCTSSPYGFGYTRIDLKLVTDAGVITDFTEGFTITGIPRCDD